MLGIAIVIGFGMGFCQPHGKTLWIVATGIFVTFILVLAQIYESGRAFQLISCSGVRIPILYQFCGRFARNVAPDIQVHRCVQMPALLAWSILCGILITNFNELPVMDGIMYGLRGGCLLFAGRFILIVFGFSSGTNDSTRFGVSNALLLICVMTLGALFLALGGVGLLIPKHGPAWLLTAFAMLDAYVFFQVYAWFYRMNFFDLMSLRRR